MVEMYNNILSAIKKCENGNITIVNDYNGNSNDFLFILKNDLKKEYDIIENVDYYNLNKYSYKTNKKTILIINNDQVLNTNIIFQYNYNFTIILILKIKKYINYSNIPAQLLYSSDLIISIYYNNVNFIKSRYGTYRYDTININDFISRIRKYKLKNIYKNII